MVTPRILVVGSINVDIVALTERLPTRGRPSQRHTAHQPWWEGAESGRCSAPTRSDVRFIGCAR